MTDDQRSGGLATTLFMNKMQIDSINWCGKMIEAIDRILLFGPVKPVNPIRAELVHIIKIDAILL